MSTVNFKFGIGEVVTVTVSGEQGNVIARADYEDAQSQYLVRYKAADGRAVEGWWNESAIS